MEWKVCQSLWRAFGRLVPGMANASITLSFARPDGTDEEMEVVTFEKGAFNFTCTPGVAGSWTVTARWQSDKGYYSSAYSENMPIEVAALPTPPPPPNGGGRGTPIEYFYAIVAAVVIIAVIIGAVAMRRRAK